MRAMKIDGAGCWRCWGMAVVAAFLLGPGIAATGCGDSGPAATRQTPQGTLVTVDRALREGDRARVKECFHYKDDLGERFVDTFFEFSDSIVQLKQAITRQWGSDAIQALEEGDPTITLTVGIDSETIGPEQVSVEGDQAIITTADDERIRLVRREGRWSIDVVSLLEAEGVSGREDTELLIRTLSHGAEVFDRVRRERIVDSDLTLDEARQPLLQAIFAISSPPGAETRLHDHDRAFPPADGRPLNDLPVPPSRQDDLFGGLEEQLGQPLPDETRREIERALEGTGAR